MAEVLSGKRLQILNFIADCQRDRLCRSDEAANRLQSAIRVVRVEPARGFKTLHRRRRRRPTVTCSQPFRIPCASFYEQHIVALFL